MEIGKLSNWGKWGADDQRGTLNYITPEIVKNAVRLVRQGRVFSLGATLGGNGVYLADVLRKQPWRFTSSVRMENTPEKFTWAEDMVTLSSHSGTHIDALSHAWYGGRMYNNFGEDKVDGRGARRNSIENVKSLVGRGILLDVAKLKNVEHLERDCAITPQDLEDCLKAEGIDTAPGDVILVRTGWMKVFHSEGHDSFVGSKPGILHAPGLSYRVAEWLHLRQVCAVGVDNWACEVQPSELPGSSMPFHSIFIRDLGGYIMEMLDLEELSSGDIYEFLFVTAPLQLSRGCGSPVNPLAII